MTHRDGPGLLTRLPWRKSARGVNNGNCVEVAELADGEIFVRDSQESSGTVLPFTDEEWRAFMAEIRNRESDSRSRYGRYQFLRDVIKDWGNATRYCMVLVVGSGATALAAWLVTGRR